jgi:hypothetical protein
MLGTDHAVSLILFRQQSIDWSLSLPFALADEISQLEPSEPAITRFRDLLETGRRWATHSRLWCVHGPALNPRSVELIELAPESFNYLGRAEVVQELGRSFSWCIIPWGGDFTAQMIAFISFDNSQSKRALEFLRENHASDLLVSTYTINDLNHHRFRGAIFGRKTSERAQHLWKEGQMNSALALRADEALGSPSQRNSTVLEKSVSEFGRDVRLAWIRISDEMRFLQCATDQATKIITSDDLPPSLMQSGLDNFDEVRIDPLRFGLSALSSSSWIYIPQTERDKLETFISQDPLVTTAIFQSKALTSSSFFAHRSFC